MTNGERRDHVIDVGDKYCMAGEDMRPLASGTQPWKVWLRALIRRVQSPN